MRRALFFTVSFVCLSILSTAGVYDNDYLSGSGVVKSHIDTGMGGDIDSKTLLHWRGPVIHCTPIVFDDEKVSVESLDELNEIAELVKRNTGRIAYISIEGHISSIVDDETRIEIDGWSAFWQGMGGVERPDREKAVSLVNRRLKYIYDTMIDSGIPSRRISVENRLDRDPMYTEATTQGRRLNNRVEITLYVSSSLK
jgi:hypothetical protein